MGSLCKGSVRAQVMECIPQVSCCEDGSEGGRALLPCVSVLQRLLSSLVLSHASVSCPHRSLKLCLEAAQDGGARAHV